MKTPPQSNVASPKKTIQFGPNEKEEPTVKKHVKKINKHKKKENEVISRMRSQH
jgi:hypothetical protein